MKIKLDENLPVRLTTELAKLGHDVDTVPQEQLQGRSDHEVWNAAQAAGRFLVTQDMDFSDLRRFAPGQHAGVMVVRLQAPSRQALSQRIMALFREEDVEAWAGFLVVATDRKIRIRRS